MATLHRAMAAGVAAAAVSLFGLQAPATAAPPVDVTKSKDHHGDNRSDPLTAKQQRLRQEALTKQLSGGLKTKKMGASKVAKLGDNKYIELAREKTDKIFAVLVEFGNERHPDYPDLDPDDRPNPATTFDGPVHNSIEEPDRSQDNTSIWKKDFSADHFRDLYFGDGRDTVKSYYESQSSGRYSVEGTVSDWVKVKYNEARYGRHKADGSDNDSDPWALVQDGVNAWVEQQKAAGKTDDEIKAALSEYDVWDRFDYDGDGNFNEKDGYIDHFQIVHGGSGEETGGGAQGEDAIWSHKWYAYASDQGRTGPDYNRAGGAQIGETGVWVGPYTMQPEDGGLGVFAHEYGHDLGLPDLYDQTYTGESPTGFWSIMASGSYLGPGDENGLGTRPGDMGAWEKHQLGWLDLATLKAGDEKRVKLGPAEFTSAADDVKQALAVELPKKPVDLELAKPPEGSKAWWSEMGDDLKNWMSREVQIPEAGATLEFDAWWETEKGYDFASVEVDDGTEAKSIQGNITRDLDGSHVIDGSSEGWKPATFDLSAYKGKTVKLSLKYVTDGAIGGRGLLADKIAIKSGDQVIFSDGAEDGDNGWTLKNFKATTGVEHQEFDQFYFGEYRTYKGYDAGLKTGPYNFGNPQKPNWVDHYPYQDGLLVSYWDDSFTNNQTGVHPGEGQILPIDARPKPRLGPDGKPLRTRINVYDATFGRQRTDAFSMLVGGKAVKFGSQKAVPKFDDTLKYWYAEAPDQGVKLPQVGVTMKVVRQTKGGMIVKVGSK